MKTDLILFTNGFNSTKKTFYACNKKGQKALKELGGGFACTSISYKASFSGDVMDHLRFKGYSVSIVRSEELLKELLNV
jgi:hypothetical protein|tara:strand:+ start:102 stop:338 length:237 start_codon:yes stop_codon:yes gene_type:complete